MTRASPFPRLLAAACLVPLGLAALPRAALAHAILIDSVPAIGGSVPAGHVSVTLRFNSRIDRARSRLTLTGPAAQPAILATADDPRPDVLVAAADLSVGGYTLRWQVLAVDGHITRGDVPFTVTAATSSKP